MIKNERNVQKDCVVSLFNDVFQKPFSQERMASFSENERVKS